MACWYAQLWGLTEAELLEESKRLYRKAMDAEFAAKGFQSGCAELRKEYVDRVFDRKEIRRKSRCRTSDGLVGVFDSVDRCGNISVCLLGARGRPYKHPHIYPYEAAEAFKPEEKT